MLLNVSFNETCTMIGPGGGIGRHAGLKIQWTVMSVRVQVPSSVQIIPEHELTFSGIYISYLFKIIFR